jgi:hypothetical protein
MWLFEEKLKCIIVNEQLNKKKINLLIENNLINNLNRIITKSFYFEINPRSNLRETPDL